MSAVLELIGLAVVVIMAALVGFIIVAIKLQQLVAALDDVLGQ